MTTRTDAVNKVLNRLRGALGTKESPDGSNSNFIVDWYNKNVDRIGNGPWCEMTNTWSVWTSGFQKLKKGRAYTVWAAGDAQKKVNGSEWHWGTKGMRAGDQLYFDWKGGRGTTGIVDHTGTVEKINGNGTFYTLEGNFGNQLRRMLRDSKYVVGYSRLDYSSLEPEKEPTPKPTPPKNTTKPKPNRELTVDLQRIFRVTPDGKWGTATDDRAKLMRKAAKATVGSPKRVAAKFDVKQVQRIIGATPDGVWGPRSQASMAMWVKLFQRAAGTEVGGHWGPKTDNRFLAVRKQNLNNF